MTSRNQLAAGWPCPDPDGRTSGKNLLIGAALLLRAIAGDLHPAGFALVMATGSLSIATRVLGMPQVATAFFWLNIVSFALLWLLVLSRLLLSPGSLCSDIFDNVKGPAFFTVVAGTATVGTQFMVVRDSSPVGMVWWFAALFLWLCLAYAGFGSQTVRAIESDGKDEGNGGWGIAIAAAQSIATPSAALALSLNGDREETLAFALAIAVVGGVFYGSLIAFACYRYAFSKFSVAAIVKSLTLLVWATGAWWIPLRAVLGLSGHLFRRFPLANPLYWGVVFALSTYAVGIYRLAELIDLPLLVLLARFLVFLALSLWAIVAFGWVRRTVKRAAALASLARGASSGRIAPESGSLP